MGELPETSVHSSTDELKDSRTGSETKQPKQNVKIVRNRKKERKRIKSKTDKLGGTGAD